MTFELEILAPDEVILSTRAISVQAADASGRFGIRAGHEPFETVLAPSLFIYTDETGRERYAAIDGGVMLLEGGRLTIVTREAILASGMEELAKRARSILDARLSRERRARTEFSELQTVVVKQLAQVSRQR